MLSKQEEVIRVGVWVVVVAAIVGLVVLLLTGVAYPQEPSQPEDMARLLVPGTGPSAGERLEEARSLLREDRRRRLGGLHLALVDTAWQVFTQASPKRLLQSARRVFRQVRGWRVRSPAEDRALDLLEAEVRAGSEDSQLRELYQELRGREDRERLKRLLREAERAIAAGDLRLARRRLERVRALDPHAPRVAAASQALEERETALKTVPESQASPEIEGLEAWEAPLGAALLLERYGFALELPSARPDAALAQAVAAYLSGATDEALESMQRLSEFSGPTGDLARRWLQDPARNPEAASAARPLKRLIGAFVDAGAEREGARAYPEQARRGSLRPLKLAISLPDRITRGSRAAGAELRKVALRSLKLAPAQEPMKRPRAWEDGYLVLPPAHTRYSPISARPVLLSRAALELALGERARTLAAGLGEAEAVWLEPQKKVEDAAGQGLSQEHARVLMAALATGIEDGKLRSHSQGLGMTLERIRRIDSALRRGASLAVTPWSPRSRSIGKALKRSLLKGDTTRLGSVHLKPRGRAVNLAKTWRGREFRCPQRTVCVDRTRALQATFYGRLDLSANARVGARTSFHNARLGLELSRSGPHGSLVLPLADWLGLSHWLPVEAYFEFSLGGISAGPRFVRPRSSKPGASPG